MIDLRNKINESSQFCLVKEFKITGYRNLQPFSIKIWKSLEDNSYYGKCEYQFLAPLQEYIYHYNYSYESIEDAFNDALKSITDFDYIKLYPNEVVFFIKYDGKEKVYIDGNGETVSYIEVQNRRNKFINDN